VTQAVVALEDGRTLTYEEHGDPDGVPVVLLHGAPGSRRFVPDDATTRSRRVRLVTVDRPGYGGSTRREGRSLLDTPPDVAALADALGLDDFVLFGVSAGGAHALACAATPELAPRLRRIGVASGPGPLDEVPGAWDAMPPHMRPTAEMARHDPERSIRAVVRYMQGWVDDPPSYLGDGGPAPDRAVLADPAVRPMLLDDVHAAFRQGALGLADDLVASWRPWGFTAADVVPGVLLWHGAHDTRAEGGLRYLAGALPDARLNVWPDQGHYGVLPEWASVLDGLLDTP
jgi:pimeloyl-ACP methyl ester carboxylesterase